MQRFLIGICSTSVFLLSACGLASPGRCPSGDPFSIFLYCEQSHNFPYGARWVKEGMTRESRLGDWVACGGGSDLQDGFRNWIQPEPRESFFPQREAHRKNLWRCMGESGYEYFIQGYEFELPKVSGKPERCTAQICLYP